jgi:signal transduction histidine kinase
MNGPMHSAGKRPGSALTLLGKGLIATVVLIPMLAMLAASGQDIQAGQPRRVLILESFGRDFAVWDAVLPAFKQELAQMFSGPIEFHEAALETARVDQPRAETAFVEYLRALYAQHPPDLVVPVGAPAAQFLCRHRAGLFSQTPILIGGIDQRLLPTLSLTSKDAAVVAQLDFAACFEILWKLFPATTNLVMVMGDSPLERLWVAECRRAFQPYTNGLQITWLNELSFPEMCRRVASLPPRSVVAYGSLLVDAAGVPHEQMRALEQLSAVANAPVFGTEEEQLGRGIIGGSLTSGRALGVETARLAARVLRGEPPGSIAPPVVGAGPPIFDWRQLQRWRVSERQLPPGSVVRFRQPTLWQRYRWYVLGALGIMTAQAATILGLVLHRARRRAAEAAAYQIGGRLITAQEEERRRIARELHDDLNQRLALLSVELDVACHAEARSPMTPRLEKMARQVKDVSSEVHKLSYQLHPAKLDQLGLVTAARAYCHEVSSQAGFPIRFTAQNVPREMPAEIALCVYRVLQEALGNTLRHGEASEVRAELRLANHHLHLVVSDDGIGFDLAQGRNDGGLGLVSMEERARLVHGTLRIRTSPGRGTRVELTVPVEPGAGQAEEGK